MTNKSTSEQLTVLCGGNIRYFDDMAGTSIADLRNKCGELMAITPDHTKILVDGNPIKDESMILNGSEYVEFVKPAGNLG